MMLAPEIGMDKALQNVSDLPRRGQLLVVDDNEAIQGILSSILSFMRYEVTVADNGLEALALFRNGSYDLVMTDFQMPLMNGCELSRLVKEQSPNTPVVVVTGCCDNKEWEKLNMNWIDAIILKPFNLKEIEKTVRTLLSNEA